MLTISVIIPTYNRKDSLLRTLESLKQQTFPMNRFEVIVVDDGSIDDTQVVASQKFSFAFRYVHQKQQGATAARNYGATISMGEILVFIDDDVTVSPPTLEALAEVCCQNEKAIVMGTLSRRSSVIGSVYTATLLASPDHYPIAQENLDLHLVHCNTQLLVCRRSDFLDLGMLQDPTGGHGWPNWDDVDFGYRAHLNGFRLLQSSKATGYHWDYSITDWTVACQRWYRASKSAVWLFKRHQELQKFIPMLRDKTPPRWGKDSFMLVVRKLTRSLGSSGPVIWIMVRLVSIIEQHFPSPVMLRHLYYWLQGASMFHGYREGLRELKLAGARD